MRTGSVNFASPTNRVDNQKLPEGNTSWLGTGFINLGWLAFVGTPLWGALALAIGWFVFVFKKV